MLGGKEAGAASENASTGEVHPPEQRAEEVHAFVQKGFKSIKLRVKNFKLTDDVAQIEAVRREVPSDLVFGASG